jgi:hypothetical protein
MRRQRSGSSEAGRISRAVIRHVFSSNSSTCAPRLSINCFMISTSCMRGMFRRTTGSSVNMHAASKGNAAFLFPDGVTSPRNGTPPSITNFSMGSPEHFAKIVSQIIGFGKKRSLDHQDLRLSGNCRDCYASSCTSGRRQCNCRRNWRFITATRKDPDLLQRLTRALFSRADTSTDSAQVLRKNPRSASKGIARRNS